MTIRSYGPTLLATRPPDAAHVQVLRSDGRTPLTLTTPVAVNGQGQVSWAADDGGNPPLNAIMRVTNTAGQTQTVQVQLGSNVAPPPASPFGGRVLARAALDTSTSAVNTTSTANSDVAGLQVGCIGGQRMLRVRLHMLQAIALGGVANGTVARVSGYLCEIDAAGVVTVRDTRSVTQAVTTGNNYFNEVDAEYRFQPTPGQGYTFKAQQSTNRSGLALGVYAPDLGARAFIEIVEEID